MAIAFSYQLWVKPMAKSHLQRLHSTQYRVKCTNVIQSRRMGAQFAVLLLNIGKFARLLDQ